MKFRISFEGKRDGDASLASLGYRDHWDVVGRKPMDDSEVRFRKRPNNHHHDRLLGMRRFCLGAGGAALSNFAELQGYAIALVGIWLLVSPWVLSFAAFSLATTNAVVFGAALLIIGGWVIYDFHRIGRA